MMSRLSIVCLCGSTRFKEVFQEASLRETLAGSMVLSIGTDLRDDEVFGKMPNDKKAMLKHYLDVLHFHKIAAADDILVLNVGGYIGESTTREVLYALSLGKGIRWWEPDSVPEIFQEGDRDVLLFDNFINGRLLAENKPKRVRKSK